MNHHGPRPRTPTFVHAMLTPPIDFRRFDTELGSWCQAVWRPHALAGVVGAIWYFEGKLTYPRERLFPPGAPEIVVHMRGGLSRDGATAGDRAAHAEVVGQITEAIVIDAPDEHSAVLGIRLDPAGAYRLFGHPVHELTGETVALADLTAEAAERLAEACAGVTSVEQLLRAAASWVASRAAPADPADPAVRWAVSRLRESHGRLRIDDLRERCGMSRTRFTTTFREQVGVAPKALARVTRFQRALDLVRDGAGPLSDVALRCGYYDQAHFTTEFRRISGFTPGAFPSARFFPANTSYMAEPAG